MAEVKLQWTSLVTLNDVNVESIPDNTKGAYRLSYTPDEGKHFYVFFIGKSENIKQSLLSYLRLDNVNNCISNHIKTYSECRFRYAAIEDSNVRYAAERQLYKFYQPSCNTPIQSVDESIIINVT